MKRAQRTAEELAWRSRALTEAELRAMEDRRLALLAVACDRLKSDRTRAMVSDMVLQQLEIHMDPHRWISICGARRSAKTTYISMDTIVLGEERPGYHTMIGAPTKEWLREHYWNGDSGVIKTAEKYGLKLDTNENDMTWRHPNGSSGILKGMKGQREVEAWFGAEANRYALDEQHRQSHALYRLALDKAIAPQMVSRKATVIVACNPGDVCAGDLYRATDPGAENSTAIPFDQLAALPEEERGAMWSFHHMTQQGNTAMPHQWAESLAIKKRNRWADDNPNWMQQELGLWVYNQENLRFRYDPDAALFTLNPGSALYALGVWMGEEATYFSLVAYDPQAGKMALEWESTCSLSPETVVRHFRLAEARANGSLAWSALGSEKPMSDVLFTWFQQAGLSFERFRKSERASYLALANGALEAGRLAIPNDTPTARQLSEAAKGDSPGYEYTDALLVAVGQLPAPYEGQASEEAPYPYPTVPPAWRAAYLPPDRPSSALETDVKPKRTWQQYLGGPEAKKGSAW